MSYKKEAKFCDCGKLVEAEQYEFCKDCWWEQDPRNPQGFNFDAGLFIENPAKPEDFNNYIVEELKVSLAQWINLANYRGNKLFK